MDDKRRKDLEDVMRAESRRGRRPVDLESRREQMRKMESMRRYLALGTEEEFREAMRGVGLRDGSPEFLIALQLWREYRA
jgi:hypothetical protein